MRYWYDTEFIEDGHTIDLISIGIVAEDGREYYAQSVEHNPTKASDWVKEHVLSTLPLCGIHTEAERWADWAYHEVLHGECSTGRMGHVVCPWRSRKRIKDELLAFMSIEKYGNPELWGYYSAYDHVVFAQLFGTMMDLPKGYPMYTRDLKQWADQLGAPIPRQPTEGEHNALVDACYNQIIYRFLDGYEKAQGGSPV